MSAVLEAATGHGDALLFLRSAVIAIDEVEPLAVLAGRNAEVAVAAGEVAVGVVAVHRRAAFEDRAQLFVERVRKQCRDDRRRQAQLLEERRDALQRRLGISGHVGRALRREKADTERARRPRSHFPRRFADLLRCQIGRTDKA